MASRPVISHRVASARVGLGAGNIGNGDAVLDAAGCYRRSFVLADGMVARGANGGSAEVPVLARSKGSVVSTRAVLGRCGRPHRLVGRSVVALR